MCIHVYLHHTAYLLLLLLYNEVVKGPFLSFSLLIKSKGPLHHHHLKTLFKTLNIYMGFRVFFPNSPFSFWANWFVPPHKNEDIWLPDDMAITAGYGNAKFVDDAQVRRRKRRFFCCGRRLVLLGCRSFLPLLLFFLLVVFFSLLFWRIGSQWGNGIQFIPRLQIPIRDGLWDDRFRRRLFDVDDDLFWWWPRVK